MNGAALFHSHPSILARLSCKQSLCGLRSQNSVQSTVGPSPRRVEGWGGVGCGGGGEFCNSALLSATVLCCTRLCPMITSFERFPMHAPP